MLIRKNTKVYKVILHIVTACKGKPNRKNLVRLYITRAGHSIKDRISTEALQGDSDVFYELNYDAVLNNLTSSDKQLHESETTPGIYFFQTSSNKSWDETPFEFDESVKKEFGDQADLPMLRKKEAVKPYTLPAANTESKNTGRKKEFAKNTSVISKKAPQPKYGLRQDIEFTELAESIGFAEKVTKKDALDYYHAVSDYMVAFLKDRPIAIKPKLSYNEINTIDQLIEYADVPDWIQKNARGKGSLLTCNDKEHLLWYVEMGCVEFKCSPFKIKSPNAADYIVVGIHSEEENTEHVMEAALAARVVLQGLQFPSFATTDGHHGLHIYLPLQTDSVTISSRQFAEYICKLVRLKNSELISVYDAEADHHNKVTLHDAINESANYLIAPYSLVAGDHPVIAAPLAWDSVGQNTDLSIDFKTALEKLRDDGDPIKNFSKKKTDIHVALKKLEDHYAFLL